jgi:hypothetical protein
MALAQSQPRPQQTYLAQQGAGRGGPSGLAEVLDVLLDKGLVIDAFVRVSLVGIELLTIDARVVVASVDTYLRFAEAVNRLDLQQANNSQNLGDLVGGSSKALSSQGSREEPAERDEPKNGDDEPEAEHEPDAAPEPPQESDGTTEDDKGILTRIKERGQVF